jgi:hypothetical protein
MFRFIPGKKATIFRYPNGKSHIFPGYGIKDAGLSQAECRQAKVTFIRLIITYANSVGHIRLTFVAFGVKAISSVGAYRGYCFKESAHTGNDCLATESSC